mmetsp:Transcript_1426/g.1872  ORF Transcript_1426/g.1872 Transcript_1426/m.1872 type:complete len:142 (+) Transcript_1426:300-725(+)
MEEKEEIFPDEPHFSPYSPVNIPSSGSTITHVHPLQTSLQAASYDQSEVSSLEEQPAQAKKLKVKNKKVASLINRWMKIGEEERVKEQQELEKEKETPEERSRREIEKWRLQQIQSGSSDKNPNLLPLGPRMGSYSSTKHF